MQISRLIGRTITDIKREEHDSRNISLFDQYGNRILIIVENAAGGNLDAVYDGDGNYLYMDEVE